MRIYRRYCDKVTITLFIISIILIFLFSVGILVYNYLAINEYYESMLPCYQVQSFQCLAEKIVNPIKHKDNLLLLLSLNTSFIGVIIGFLIVSIYKDFKFFRDRKNETR